MTQYGFYFDSTRCTGCRTCEIACADYKDSSDGIHYRKVYDYEGGACEMASDGTCATTAFVYHVSLGCQHCTEPACVRVCPTGAMHKDENGIVSVDTGRCIGCGYCHMACPYDAPFVDRAKGHSVKCDGCKDRIAEGKQPLCVDACSMRALQFAPVDQLPEGERANVAPLPDPELTKPNLYIKNCAAARPAGDTSCRVANEAEVK